MVTHSQAKLNQTLYEEDFYLWIETTTQLPDGATIIDQS